MSERPRVLILGAGGREFHVFNTRYRDDPSHEVVGFAAAQVPHLAGRTYPPVLSGPLYPDGLPIVAQDELEAVVSDRDVDRVELAYSDVSLGSVAALQQRVEATGAAFAPFDPDATLLETSKPCVAVCAVRTGCGKTGVARYVTSVLRELGHRTVVVRHPMAYGNLEKQVVQRFATTADLDAHDCTIEEREEYEPHLADGHVVFAGADYERVLEAAEAEADVLVWDGGNNDAPFFWPTLLITLLDPLRAGDETAYFPSRWNLERAHVLLIGKSNDADPMSVAHLRAGIARHNPRARVIDARSAVRLEDDDAVAGKRVLVVEDGPTVTHGGMAFGAGYVAATRVGAEIVDPRPFAVGELAATLAAYPHLDRVLPAMGYGARQVADLGATLDAADCDVVVAGTPADLGQVVATSKPVVRAHYRFEEAGGPGLAGFVRQRFPSA